MAPKGPLEGKQITFKQQAARFMALTSASVLVAMLSLMNASTHASSDPQHMAGWTSGRSFASINVNDLRQTYVQVSPQTSGAGPTSTMLPNGANALKESYGDWAVECRIVEAQKRCSIGQFQYDQQQRAVMFSIEILAPENGGYRVAVGMPFGLNLSDGIQLQLEGDPTRQRASFATCLPTGCIVPLKISGSSIEMMKLAKKLTVSATALGSGQSSTFNVSLNGFSAAIERLNDLR